MLVLTKALAYLNKKLFSLIHRDLHPVFAQILILMWTNFLYACTHVLLLFVVKGKFQKQLTHVSSCGFHMHEDRYTDGHQPWWFSNYLFYCEIAKHKGQITHDAMHTDTALKTVVLMGWMYWRKKDQEKNKDII